MSNEGVDDAKEPVPVVAAWEHGFAAHRQGHPLCVQDNLLAQLQSLHANDCDNEVAVTVAVLKKGGGDEGNKRKREL